MLLKDLEEAIKVWVKISSGLDLQHFTVHVDVQ